MILRPLRATRTDTLFPYTTRVRAHAVPRTGPARAGRGSRRRGAPGIRRRRPRQLGPGPRHLVGAGARVPRCGHPCGAAVDQCPEAAGLSPGARGAAGEAARSEEHTSELQSLMRISYAVFCLKKKNTHTRIASTKKLAKQ